LHEILNIDETGLSVRPLKGQKRKIVFLKTCCIIPSFREEKDVSHVSLVATVTLGGQPLTPLWLRTFNILFKSEELVNLRQTFVTYRTLRGYITKQSMDFYLNIAVAPYMTFLRLTNGDPGRMVYLGMDNHGTHSTSENFREIAKLGIQPIWLPPHASHFLQPLDLTGFGVFKKNSSLARRIPTTPKIEGKLIRSLYAWHNSADIQTIYHRWKAGGVQVRGPLSDTATPEPNTAKIGQIIRKNWVDTPATPGTDARD
jgi:hypothetical protein